MNYKKDLEKLYFNTKVERKKKLDKWLKLHKYSSSQALTMR